MVKGQSNISTATVMSGMIAIGIVGYLIDVALRRVEARINANRGRGAK
jgi:NitT/TauT family transport system permease protein